MCVPYTTCISPASVFLFNMSTIPLATNKRFNWCISNASCITCFSGHKLDCCKSATRKHTCHKLTVVQFQRLLSKISSVCWEYLSHYWIVNVAVYVCVWLFAYIRAQHMSMSDRVTGLRTDESNWSQTSTSNYSAFPSRILKFPFIWLAPSLHLSDSVILSL